MKSNGDAVRMAYGYAGMVTSKTVSSLQLSRLSGWQIQIDLITIRYLMRFSQEIIDALRDEGGRRKRILCREHET